jgi:hypothetical protein
MGERYLAAAAVAAAEMAKMVGVGTA